MKYQVIFRAKTWCSYVKITLSSHVKDHHCYGYKINRAFHNKKLLKWNALVFHWCFIISRTLHGFLEIQDFCSRVEEILHSFAVLTREIFFNTQREISYFREAMYYPLCLYIFSYINIILSLNKAHRRSRTILQGNWKLWIKL